MTKIQLRRGTTAQWAAANPVLSAGEPGVDLTTGDHKIGNGVSTWSALPGQASGGGAANDDRLYHLNAYDTFFGGISGAYPDARWVNSTHLATWTAFAQWIAAAQSPPGQYVINGTNPKVVMLGDSWFANGTTAYETAIKARISGATVINAGVGGDKSADLLARFATDVAVDADFVVFNEPGVNDDTAGVTQAVQTANLETLVAKIRDIGAIPVYTGHVPLSDTAAFSTKMHNVTLTQIADGRAFPAVPASVLPPVYAPEADSVAVGNSALGLVTSGTTNTAVGKGALASITTSSQNTAVGNDALQALTSGSQNTAIGKQAMYQLTSGAANVCFGVGALASLITGSSNCAVGNNAAIFATGANGVYVGYAAGYRPGGVVNATTTGVNNTFVGAETGGQDANDNATALGYQAVASGWYSTALGSKTTAAYNGSVAIGMDSSLAGATTGATDEIALGTSSHKVKVRGRLNVAQRTPTSGADTSGAVGDIASDDSYLYAKTSTGWKRVAIATW